MTLFGLPNAMYKQAGSSTQDDLCLSDECKCSPYKFETLDLSDEVRRTMHFARPGFFLDPLSRDDE